MLAQDFAMWGFNIYFLIGLLIFLAVSGVVLTGLYVGLRMYLFARNQRRSMEEYRRRTRRVDGKMYPPFIGGICDQCRGIRTKVYHLSSGEKLCIECYEVFWRTAEGWTDPMPPRHEESLLERLRAPIKRAPARESTPEEQPSVEE